MKLVPSVLACSMALILSAGVAQAQSAPAGTGTPITGPSTGTGGGGKNVSKTPKGPTDLDLPIDPKGAEYQPKTPEKPKEDPPPPENKGDDPTDTPPPTIYGEEIHTETDSIIYVIDISCSMDWDSRSYTTLDGHTRTGYRIDRAKAELSRSIMGLAKNFKFNIISYSCGVSEWKHSKQPADDAHKQDALSWVNALEPEGATGTGPATCLALQDRANKTVVLLTDGAPNCGASPETCEGHRRMIAAGNSQGAQINVFGIAAYGQYKAFCQGVAADSGGSYFDVP